MKNKTNNTAQKTTEHTEELDTYLHNFGIHLGTAIDAIDQAARNYAAAIRDYPETAQQAFEDAYPHVTRNTWDKLRLIGNGEADAKVMLLSDKFAARIIRLPVAKQRETLNGDSFAIVNAQTRKIENVNYYNLKPRQERILFDDERGQVRSIPEQVAYIDRENARKKTIPRPYTVETDALVIHQACRIGKVELIDIVEGME